MKQARNLALATLVTVGLFTTSCNHHNDPYEVTPQAHALPAGSEFNRTASPEVEDNTPSDIRWQSGYIGIRSMAFDGEMLMATGEKRHVNVNYETPVQLDLMKPDLSRTLKIQYGSYSRTVLRMNVASGSFSKHALYLQGSFFSGTQAVPVAIMVDGRELISAQTGDLKVSDGNEYISRVSLDVQALTSGISSKTLNTWDRTDGTVVISSTSNVEAYRMVLANMQKMLKVKAY